MKKGILKTLIVCVSIGTVLSINYEAKASTLEKGHNKFTYNQEVNNRELYADDNEIDEKIRELGEKLLKNKKNIYEKEKSIKMNGKLEILEKNLDWNGELNLTNEPQKIVLHHIEASRQNSNIGVEEVHSWHLANGWTGIGYHFYINKNGKIYRGRPENAIGAHAKDNNVNTISIAVEGRYGIESMNYVQKKSVVNLGQYLRQKYDIEEIKGHGELMPTNCPGKNYPLDEIRKAIKSEVIVPGDTYSWELKDGKWYYSDSWTGEFKSGWLNLNNTWYYMDKNGVMLTGWQKINGKWYYLWESGSMKIGWLNLNNTWYYMDKNGQMLTGWQKINGKWYYLWESGSMKTGWLNLNNTWYYMDKNGEMLTGWQKIDSKWYYLWESGSMKTGWLNLNNIWYYMDKNGQMLTGWQKIDNKLYYMNNSGEMAVNTVIDGIIIDGNGVAAL